jgi:transcriptional regulator with XRE-family HTH domain
VPKALTDPSKSELGDFLRSRREKLTASAVGLANGSRRRRTPGLRREEVAELAGIGVDWYVRLEQGRSVNPSATTIDALARALRLTKVEHAHLRSLARSSSRRTFSLETVPDTLRRLLDALTLPAYVTGRRWDLLAWNEAADAIFSFGRLPPGERNILFFMLTAPGARRLFGSGWAAEAKRMVAQFRSTHDLWAGDPAFRDLEARMRAGSRELPAWWDAHEIRSPASGVKVLHHPRRGLLRFEHSSFQANDDPALKLVLYSPIGGVRTASDGGSAKRARPSRA